jgi:hypothetical protein
MGLFHLPAQEPEQRPTVRRMMLAFLEVAGPAVLALTPVGSARELSMQE